MKYQHHFIVQAPLATVADFHRQSASMGAITPPPVIVRVHHAPALLDDGDQMEFTLWLGPLPLHWHAQIEIVPGKGFIDRQISGPFAKWEHRHTFESVNEEKTVVFDEVTAEFSRNWFWKLVGGGMWLTMPLLFAFRGWKTRQILENKQKIDATPSASSSL